MTHVPWHDEALEEALEDGEELHGFESVELISVGIDIGTTTTHLMLSRLVARREGEEQSSEFSVVERDVIYESPVRFTPYEDEHTIDTEAVGEIIEEAYADAGYSPSDVDTGAVIITGEACRKENAEAIIDLFSKQSGEFVCATAGANLETLMAAHGSGAVEHSLETDQNVLNLDIGGGTAKLAYIVDGIVEETAAINVGARLVAFDEVGAITRLEDAAKTIGADIGLNLEYGQILTTGERKKLADRMADLLLQVVDSEYSDFAEELMVTDPPDSYPIDVLTFSGGGAEYIYNWDTTDHGDLGRHLGNAIHKSIAEHGYHVDELDAGIRATVLGSTQHSMQVSGSTIKVTEDALPVRDVPVVPFVADHDESKAELSRKLSEKLDMYDVDLLDENFAMGFHLHGPPSRSFLERVVLAAQEAKAEFISEDAPLILVFDTDVALNVGRIAKSQMDSPIIAVDGIDLQQFGYLDIGTPLEYTHAVPLVMKSLVFEG